MKKRQPKSTMGIASPTGSHLPLLGEHVAALPAGSLVIEHGAGLYSTPLLERHDVRVICAESHPGWADWARWMYDGNAEVVTFEVALSHLGETVLVFIDGPAKERGPLLRACLARRVPTIIMHDTGKRDLLAYGIDTDVFSADAYDVTHHAEDSHRTTMWRLK